jgi:hypothetical protein
MVGLNNNIEVTAKFPVNTIVHQLDVEVFNPDHTYTYTMLISYEFNDGDFKNLKWEFANRPSEDELNILMVHENTLLNACFKAACSQDKGLTFVKDLLFPTSERSKT